MRAKLQALWTVEVRSAGRWLPGGVLLFHLRRVFGDFYEEGRMFGGDRSYVYTGDYRIENLRLIGELQVARYAPAEVELFGPGERIQVALSAPIEETTDRDVVEIAAQAKGRPKMLLRLTRRARLD